MDRKIRVGAVSYLNTKPLLYGIENSPVINEIDLITHYPSRIADMLLNDEIDIGLVPVTTILQMKDFHLNTGYCIGCNGAVASVCLLSESPIEEIQTVLLDYQSRTSVALTRLLFGKHWKLKPVFEDGGPDFLQNIQGHTAAVVIGDRALIHRKHHKYVYDLGEAWKQFTGLPFVFAAWVSNKTLDSGWVSRFDRANEMGVHHISKLVKQMPESVIDLQEYYTHYLSYEFDAEKKEGMKLFLEMLRGIREFGNSGIRESE